MGGGGAGWLFALRKGLENGTRVSFGGSDMSLKAAVILLWKGLRGEWQLSRSSCAAVQR